MEKKNTVSEDQQVELLRKIRSKEAEIEKFREEARLEANQKLEEARQTAQEILRKAQEEAEKEAHQYGESRKKNITLLTQKMMDEAHTKSERIQSEAEKNSAVALQFIISHVIPAQRDTKKEKQDILTEASS